MSNKITEYNLEDNLLYTSLVYSERIQELCRESGIVYLEKYKDVHEASKEVSIEAYLDGERVGAVVLPSGEMPKYLFEFYCGVYRKLVDLLDNKREL